MNDTYHQSRWLVTLVVVTLVVSGIGSVAVTSAETYETSPGTHETSPETHEIGPEMRATGPSAGADPGAMAQQTGGCEFDRIFDETIPSVVTVRAFDPIGERGLGTGWIYAVNGSDALVVTNSHVVEGSIGADVRFANGQWRTVRELVGVDSTADLAVLRITNVSDAVEPLQVATSVPDEGDDVAALGSPLGLEGSMSRGIVSAVDRSVTVQAGSSLYTVVDAIQIDTALSPGNSGGPLVNCDGEVVGVNFAGVSPLAGQNVNFAISASMVQRIVPEIVENGTYNHSYMGVRAVSLSPTMARIAGINGTTQGVLVDSVIADGPADGVLQGSPSTDRLTGIPVGGDVIVAVDGTPIGDVDDLRDYLFEETRPGDTITVTVIRDGDRRSTELTLAPRPPLQERASGEEPSV